MFIMTSSIWFIQVPNTIFEISPIKCNTSCFILALRESIIRYSATKSFELSIYLFFDLIYWSKGISPKKMHLSHLKAKRNMALICSYELIAFSFCPILEWLQWVLAFPSSQTGLSTMTSVIFFSPGFTPSAVPTWPK